MGWAILLALAVLAFGLLWRLGRLDRPGLMLAAAALFLAAAGYAWQGAPGEAGAPAAGADQTSRRPESLFAIERQSLLEHYGEPAQYLGTADAMSRFGDDRSAALLMEGAVRRRPKDVDLRVGLAHALLVLADGNIEAPAVQLAYTRAVAMGGSDPAPRYFFGLAYLEAGLPGHADRIWSDLDASLPANSPWKPMLAGRLRLLDMIHAEQVRMAGHDG